MKKMISKILRYYGVPAKVRHHGTLYDRHIFLQPNTARNWQSLEPVVGPLGRTPGGQYLYIGPPEQEIDRGDEILLGGRAYIVRRAEVYQDGNGPVYWWGLCGKKGGDDTWGK